MTVARVADAPVTAVPRYFGTPDALLAGCLHLPRSGADQPSIGLVLCNPFGYEEICAHRSIRYLAETASAAGLPALRFDYPGTGDSADPAGDCSLGAWSGAIAAAIEELKTSTGVSAVVVVGIRLGALLACAACEGRDDVAAVAAIAPVTSGRMYLRELRALQMALALQPPPGGTQDRAEHQEAVGFVLSSQMRGALHGADLLSFGRPAAEVLVIDRDDMPASEKWIRHLQGQGASVRHERLPGYGGMMLDPHHTQLPVTIVDGVVQWASGLASNIATRGTNVARRQPPTRLSGHGWFETFHQFGRDGALVGVMSGPQEGQPRTSVSGLALLLLNAGAIHRIGPNRLYVVWARTWAAAGATVLRMDVSGIGESACRSGAVDNVVYSTHAVGDALEAVRHLLAQPGVERVVVAGLCSGAYHALKAAAADAAVTGVVCINPLTFDWREGMTLDLPAHQVASEAKRYRKSALSLSSWLKLVRGDVRLAGVARVFGRRALGYLHRGVRDLARRVGAPLPRDVGAELQCIADGGARLNFVFSADDPGEALLRQEAGSSLKRLMARGALQMDTIAGADHTFTPTWTHDILSRRLTEIVLAHGRG